MGEEMKKLKMLVPVFQSNSLFLISLTVGICTLSYEYEEYDQKYN